MDRFSFRRLLLPLILVFLTSPPSFIFESKTPKKDESLFWQNTQINSSTMDRYINTNNCYESEIQFFGCMNAYKNLISQIEDRGIQIKWKNGDIVLRDYQFQEHRSIESLLSSIKSLTKGQMTTWTKIFKTTKTKKIPFYEKIKELIQTQDSTMEKFYLSIAINGYLSYAASPHDHLIPLDYVLEQTEKSSEEYTGIGVILRPIAGHLVVIRTLTGSPAEKSGLQTGDIITHIQGEPVSQMSKSDASQAITRLLSNRVKIDYYRSGKKKRAHVRKTQVTLENVRHYKLEAAGHDWGFIRINSFQKSNTCAQVEEVIYSFELETEISGLILDLRDNPGGLVDQALCVADLFLPQNTFILEVRSELQSRSRKRYYTRFEQATTKPIVVLINSGSASSAEIVAGTLKEHKRAVLLGERTFGKGTILQGIPFEGGKYQKIVHYQTFAKFYFPSGSSNHVTGIRPDYVIPQMRTKNAVRESDLPYYALQKDILPHSNNDLLRPQNVKLTACFHQAKTLDSQGEPTLLAAHVLNCISSQTASAKKENF